MASVARIYARGFHRDFKVYYTHWLPNSELELGVVGVLEGGYLFRPKSTLRDLGIQFDPKADIVPDNSPSPIDFTSKSGVTITTKLAGEVNAQMPSIPQGSAGIKLDFASEASFLIKARESYEPRIRDVIRLEREILKLYKAGVWDRNWCVIYSLLKAPYADLVVSETGSSSIELQVTGDAQVQQVQLGDVNLQFAMKRTSGKVLDMRESKNVTPAFQLVGLKKRLFGSVKPGVLKGAWLDAEDAGGAAAEGMPPMYLDVLTGRNPLSE